MKRLLPIALALLLTSCAHATVDPAVLAPPSNVPAPSHAPRASLPADDAPHNDLTEWWYYTGHLTAAGGQSYGFEFVIFQGQRQSTPLAYASHLAITDETHNQFHWAERTATGNQVRTGAGLSLDVNGWTLNGSDGNDHIAASMPNYGLQLDLRSVKPPALHDGNGLISFGPAGDSFYYSRTRIDARGTVTDQGQNIAVTGTAWMDHQWGNFLTSNGGWDWYSIQLDDNSEYMLFFLRDAAGAPTLPYGTVVLPSGDEQKLAPDAFQQQPLDKWTSPTTGITYPSGWRVKAGDAELNLTPTVRDQELNAVASTGKAYWEGSVNVSGTRAGKPIAGKGYVELVGYS